MPRRVLVSIVSFESARDLPLCLSALTEQRGFALGSNLAIQVTDNASSDSSALVAQSIPGVTVDALTSNLGFAAGHNRAVSTFLKGNWDYLLILNPDVRVSESCIDELVTALECHRECGLATPKLIRGDENLQPLYPTTLDAAGMILTPSIRHFDRGSGEVDQGQYNQVEEVFGGTGACLLLARRCVENLLLAGDRYDGDSARIYPQLAEGKEQRSPLFDEAFFAYREDADLAWRANILGWHCLYTPQATAIHRRVVLPERRSSLPPHINSWSVRNRFLLQLNNLSLCRDAGMLLPGVLVRNLGVIVAACTIERSSLRALWEVLSLTRRAVERRRLLFGRMARARKNLAHQPKKPIASYEIDSEKEHR